MQQSSRNRLITIKPVSNPLLSNDHKPQCRPGTGLNTTPSPISARPMCFVLIGCWPCGHMKPIRTRFCDQAEPLQPRPPLRRAPSHAVPSSLQPHGAGAKPTASTSPPRSVPSSARAAIDLGLVAAASAAARTASLAPCPKGVNQYDHDPRKVCPVCGREPKGVPAALRLGVALPGYDCGGQARDDEMEGMLGERAGGGVGSAVDSSSMWSEEELAAQIFGLLAAGGADGAGGMGMGHVGQQLLTLPAETVMLGGAAGAGGFTDADADAALFAWCMRDLPTSSCGV